MKKLLLLMLSLSLLTGFVLKRGPFKGGGTPGVPCAKFYIEDPAIELFETVVHFDEDVTISRIVCQCRGGTDIDFSWDDDETPIEDNQACPTSGGLDDTTIEFPDIAAGSDMDIDITDVNGGVTDCSVMLFCE